MSSEYAKVIQIIERLETSQDIDTPFAALVDYAAGHGLEYAFIGRLTPAPFPGESSHDFFRANYPEDWVAHYVQKDYVNIDPVVSHILISTRPFKYADSYQNLTPAQTTYVREAEAFKMNDGYVIPIHVSGLAPGSVVYASQTPFTLAPSVELSLELLGRVVFRIVERHFTSTPDMAAIRLNDREKQILPLVAQGKTNWEIAQIITLSEYSVRDYLQDLSRRLNTNNRTHTVARAVQLGLIAL